MKEGAVEGRAWGDAEPADGYLNDGVLGVAGVAGEVSVFQAGGFVGALGYLYEVFVDEGRGSGVVVS